MSAVGQSGDYRSLFTASAGEQLRRFANMRSLYPTRTVRRGAAVAELVAGDPVEVRYRLDGVDLDIADFMRRYRATGLLILKHGEIVCERYALGHGPETRWISFSMAKSITSTLLGAALLEGHVVGLDDPVTRTVPQLRGSAYDDVSIRHVLQMSSGVRWVETYLDPQSDRRQLLELQALERPGGVLDYLRALPRAAAPGTSFNYNTAETFLLGAIVAGAVGRPLSQYLSETIWQPCGMQADAYWQLESPDGQEFAGSGLSATLRDFARFGQFVLADGVVGGRRILPVDWMQASTAVVPRSRLEPGKLPGFEPLGYGYQWWTFAPRAGGGRLFGALGIFGQQIYVDVEESLVIAVHGAWPEPVHDASRLESYVFFAAVADALHGPPARTCS
jgi:CubicO group peptidase (beta-lactamase class C family)